MQSDDESFRQIDFTIDGAPRSVAHRPNESLLEVLRERCGVTSLKDGCRPQGQCGACLAVVNGQPRVTCTLPSEEANNAVITTLAGLPEDDRNRLVRAFARTAGEDQCGYCLPAIALRAFEFVERNPEPTRHEIETALDGHLCRCSGYAGFVRAIEYYALEKRGKEPTNMSEESAEFVAPRAGARERILGKQEFIADMKRPGLLHAAVVLSAHARALLKGIDTSKALQLPGVVAIVTAADVPGERYQGLLERDWPVFIAIGEETRCVGDVLVAIAAEEPAIAREAAKLIEIDYEVREPIVEPEAALAISAPRVNPKHDNLLGRTIIRRGNAEAEFENSQHVVRAIFTTQRIEHLFLEPECALAEKLPDGRLCVHSQGQSLRDEQRQIASMLGVSEDQIVVQIGPNGGAFGGKEDLTIQAHAALLTWKTGRPVKLPIDREQSIRMHPKKHPMRMEYQVGCDAEGHLTAVRARILGDSGACASVGAKVLERAASHATGPYLVPNIDVEAWAVYTNNPPSGAMRGFGVPQVTFALESCLDDLAELTGLDRWEIRYRNVVQQGDPLTTGQILDQSVGIKRCLQAIKPIWEEAENQGHAMGIACGLKSFGISPKIPQCGRVILRIEENGQIALIHAFAEMGPGVFVVLAQKASAVTGLSPETFSPGVEASGLLGQINVSTGFLLFEKATEIAAQELRDALDQGQTLKDLVGRSFLGEFINSDDQSLVGENQNPNAQVPYGFAVQLVQLDESGHIARVVAVHDVIKGQRPGVCQGQIEGAVHMGLGYALTEQLDCVKGMPTTFRMHDLGMLRARDMPIVEVILVQNEAAKGAPSAKPVGEIALVPVAAAVASALRIGDGTTRRNLPMRDSSAAKAMSVGKRPRNQRSPAARVYVHRGPG
jgi:selenium-dependent xanthine dehydrogenase